MGRYCTRRLSSMGSKRSRGSLAANSTRCPRAPAADARASSISRLRRRLTAGGARRKRPCHTRIMRVSPTWRLANRSIVATWPSWFSTSSSTRDSLRARALPSGACSREVIAAVSGTPSRWRSSLHAERVWMELTAVVLPMNSRRAERQVRPRSAGRDRTLRPRVCAIRRSARSRRLTVARVPQGAPAPR